MLELKHTDITDNTMSLFNRWRQQYLENPQVIFLVFFLVSTFSLIIFAGDILAPVLTSLVIAYVLDGGVAFLQRQRVPHAIAFSLVYLIFIAVVSIAAVVIVPLMSEQIANFLRDLPEIIARGRNALMRLPDQYPEFISAEYMNQIIAGFRNEITGIGQQMLSVSISSVAGFISFLIYVVLVPLMIFFFLKDKEKLLAWTNSLMPKKENQVLTKTVWSEANAGIAGYIRGKLIEIAIVWAVSWIIFAALGLKYAPLLSYLVGISVIIPFLGAAIVAIPVLMVAYAQWGVESSFFYVAIAYVVLQFLDGNILVPLLFSEIVNLHPVAIISAVLIFGGIWGIWGIFFAIPLATLTNAVLKAWPRGRHTAA